MTVRKKLASSLSNLDHRVLGEAQKLFFFNESSKGSCFFLPRGAHIYNRLIEYLRGEYRKRNYDEVITPNIFECRLWETSGHWQHYQDHMIKFKLGEHDFSLKPMNCPGHCLMYKNLGSITNNQLPIRWADFGALHRNELSGTLLGLTRVRRFQQDDAHIFCTPEQVETEVADCLSFAKQVYTLFGFTFELALSLRPEKYMGDPGLWDQAEHSLRQALSASNLGFTEQPLEGAFYGPKIDLIVKDCHQRSQQCATIQLDFQLPLNFDLVYKNSNADGQRARPVIIHRAILGSIERFLAMLIEHTGGRWPFWLSPVQAMIIPVHEELNEHATRLHRLFKQEGFMVECALEPDQHVPLNKRVYDAEVSRFNFILIVGDKEAKSDCVTARFAVGKKRHQISLPVDKTIELFREFTEKRVGHADREFLAAAAKTANIESLPKRID